VAVSDDEGGRDGEGRIRALDPATVDRIAAGEVVERPASVVKELVENSLDADASRVRVSVEAGGTEGVTVRDDGVGMAREELELAVEEHTTSKIRDIDDLESGVGSLGFRGEALHTIGAVSRTTIRSKPRGTDGAGTELRLEGGEVTAVDPVGCPEGTTVEVTDLFYNTPARRKFLKTEATEFDHCNTVVTQYALANPDVAVALEHGGRETFATEGQGSLEAAVLSVYGREVAESMLPVGASREDGDGGREHVRSVRGLVSHPETTRAGREYLSTFVNGRYVTSPTLRDAVLDAYGGQLAPDRYPFAVLFVDVPPAAVDVNVHPRKMEVRFDEADAVGADVESAVRESLLSAGLVRSSAPRGRSAPGETAVQPAGGDVDEAGVRGSAGGDDEPSTTHPSPADAGVEPRPPEEARAGGESGTGAGDGDDHDDTTATAGPTGRDDAPASGGGQTGADAAAGADSSAGRSDPTPASDASDAGTSQTGGDTGSSSDTGRSRARSSSGRAGETSPGAGRPETGDGTAGGRIRGPTSQRTLDGEEAVRTRAFESLPAMRVLGQLHDTYVVAETDDGLVLVDQHAADERVNYERLRAELSGETPTQALADPVELELTAREAALFDEYEEPLARLGFHAGRTGDRTVAVRTVPAVFGDALDADLLRDVLGAFVTEGRDAAGTVDAVADSLLADLACYPSVTGNTSLSAGSVVDLLSALDGCENPYACPHGRPVVIELDGDELAERFERDYPGHAGRRRE
jgi:DNA mismatch repair protein MutL